MIRIADRSRIASVITVPTNSNTQTWPYPPGTSINSFGADGDHKITGRDYTELLSRQGHITIQFLNASIQVTNNTERSFKAGAVLTLDLDLAGLDDTYDTAEPLDGVFNLFPVLVDLGAPLGSDVDGIITGYTGAAGEIPLDGALVNDDGVVVLSPARNVIIDSGGADTAVLTITGTRGGKVQVETLTLNGTTAVVGAKTFDTITSISASAAVANGAFVGTGVLLGLPVFLESAPFMLREIVNGATVTDGTFVAGVRNTPTGTNGDPTGTYSPDSAANGTNTYQLVLLARSKSYRGRDPFAG